MSAPATPSSPSGFSDQPSSRPEAGRWRGKIILGLVVTGIAVAALASRPMIIEQFSGSDDEKYAHFVTEEATTGTLLVAVNIQGSLDSQSNATLSSEVEGGTTIISIVPEGTRVKEGDVVCVLDSSMLEDEAKQQEITVTNADAAESQAKEQLEVTRSQNATDEAAARLALELAKLDLAMYRDGEFPKLQNELKGNLALAEQEAVQSEETYEFTKRLVKKGYKNQNELEAARIQVEKTKLAVEKAKEELKVLEDFQKARTMAEYTHNAEEFARELDRVKLKGKAAETQALKAHEAAEKSADLEHEKLDKLRTQIANCTLVAPQAGEVVYANLASSRRRSSDGPAIEEGAQVSERQPIINLPDVTKMKVDCRVHESLIKDLRSGLTSKVRVDMLPDETFKSRVASVSTVPMSGGWPNTDLREYEVEIHLTDDVEKVKKLRPGLTAQVEILVNSRQDVLQVPVQSVVGVGGKYFSFVLQKDGPQRRELKIGESNSTDIEIIDGIAEGERVIMNPRTHFADEIAELATVLGAERDNELGAELPPEESLGPPGGGPEQGAGPRKGGRRGQGRPGGRQGGPQADAGENGPQRRGNPAQAFARMDGNGDKKLSQDEVGGPMAENFSQIDADEDGSLTQSEVTTWFANRAQPAAAGADNKPPGNGTADRSAGGGGGN